MASALQLALAADFASLFTYDLPTTCLITINGDTRTYTVLTNDNAEEEVDELGGAMVGNNLQVIFKTADLPSLQLGSIITMQDPNPAVVGGVINRKKIVIASVTSADGSSLTLTVKGA
jgi:hypothetical protein